MKRESVKKLDSGVKIFDTPGESGKYHLFDSKSFSYFGTESGKYHLFDSKSFSYFGTLFECK